MKDQVKTPGIPLYIQVLIALVLAVIVGSFIGEETRVLGMNPYAVFDFIGTLFLNALKMLIVPLVVSSMIVGITSIGSPEKLGRLGGKVVLYYVMTSSLAILTGLLVVNMINPGIIDGKPAQEVLGLENVEIETGLIEKVENKDLSDVVEVFIRMIPTNIVDAAAHGQMLGLIFFSILFGFFMMHLPKSEGQPPVLLSLWQQVLDVMMLMTDFIMKFAPIGVFALVAGVVASAGIEVFQNLFWFVISVLSALAIHVFITLPLILAFLAKVNPFRHYMAMMPAILTAFSTSSSAATLPVTMECVEKNAGVSNSTASFVLPLGTTVNMDGTALYECVAAMFIAQAFGLQLGFTEQFLIVAVALLTSIGVAAIPAASLVAIVIILGVLGLPAEAIGLILATDRLLDMFRTTVNVFSDSCGAVVIARLEGEQNILLPPKKKA